MGGVTEDMILTVRELRGKLCRCGCYKTKGQTFCDECYYRLPEELRQGLYKSLSMGYLEAYKAAVEYLKQ